MEIFIDLAKIAGGQPESTLPGIDLNLSGLVNFNKVETSPGIIQNQLKNEPELISPGFNPIEYFGQIQAEFDKIRAAQASFSVKDDVKTFQAAQQNSNTALDPMAAYLEQRFNKIETIATNNSELRELIQGTSDNKLTEIQTIVNSPLNQVAAIEKESSVNSITDTINNLVEILTDKTQTTLIQEPALSANTKELSSSEETNINQMSQSISSLSDTISNFATTIINGGTQSTVNQFSSTTQNLAEPKKELLPITKETVKPDFAAASLSTLQDLAAMGSSNVNNLLTNSNSQINNTTNLVNPNQAGPNVMSSGQTEESSQNQVVIAGGSEGISSIYLLQMLNLMKSGQLKVKIQ
jgi:hypothetical protein